MKNIALFAAALAALVFAAPASAGCRAGDVLVTEGPHAGQCAHNGPASAAPRSVPAARKGRFAHHRGAAAPRVVPAPAGSTRSVPVALSDPTVEKITVEHPFADVPAAKQFRCNADRSPSGGPGTGTGWCYN